MSGLKVWWDRLSKLVLKKVLLNQCFCTFFTPTNILLKYMDII